MEENNKKRIEHHLKKSMSTAIRLMDDMDKGTRMYTSTSNNGHVNYQYIIKHNNGKVEQYSKFGTPSAQLPEQINLPVASNDPPSDTSDLLPLTQPDDTDDDTDIDKPERKEEVEEVTKEEEEEDKKRKIC